MKHFPIFLLGLGLVVSLSGCSPDDTSPPEKQAVEDDRQTQSTASKTYETDPVPAPDQSLKTLDGETLNLAEQDGKVVLVNFWATWCAPCRREIPDLVNLYDELRAQGLVIVGIAVDQEGAQVVEPYVKDKQINYPIVLDPEQSIEKHFEAMYGLPTTYVINPDGKIVRRVLGVFPVDEMKPDLEKMLSG